MSQHTDYSIALRGKNLTACGETTAGYNGATEALEYGFSLIDPDDGENGAGIEAGFHDSGRTANRPRSERELISPDGCMLTFATDPFSAEDAFHAALAGDDDYLIYGYPDEEKVRAIIAKMSPDAMETLTRMFESIN